MKVLSDLTHVTKAGKNEKKVAQYLAHLFAQQVGGGGRGDLSRLPFTRLHSAGFAPG